MCQMASFTEMNLPFVVKLGYINYKADPSTKMQTANCRRCKAVIKKNLGTMSVSVRHLSISKHKRLKVKDANLYSGVSQQGRF
jgi:hypothetical protein